MKIIIKIKTIVLQAEVFKKYDEKSQIITAKIEKNIENKKIFFKLLAKIFEIFAGMTKNAEISKIQKIFTEIAMKIDKKIRNHNS